ncbi:MAG: polyprenyl synthetase family protein [Caldilineaceae bacterium]|nr:polyprenyl synthetase family protein [Caldilineaceae bacterium]
MFNNELSTFLGHWLPRVEEEMRDHLESAEEAVAQLYGMLRYHMGWADENLVPQKYAAGKRLRPMLCLLATREIGGDTAQALPAAAAIELLHNFSLIHDDIEDGDEMRRHRTTLWKVWGVPQAINAGDAMFAIAFAAMQRLARRGVSPSDTLTALEIFTQTCLALTEGQHLDMSFEGRNDVSVDEYIRMIQGKTAALLGAGVAIGSLLGGASPIQQKAIQRFGVSSGLAFQIQDDILGIWGDPTLTGKAAGNDLLRAKKSLPILYTMQHRQVGVAFMTLLNGDFGPDQLPAALEMMETAGARDFAEERVHHYHQESSRALAAALGEQAAGSMLWALAEGLLNRQA